MELAVLEKGGFDGVYVQVIPDRLPLFCALRLFRRLFLEYARVMSAERDKMGYSVDS